MSSHGSILSRDKKMTDFEIDWDNVFAFLEMIIGAALFGTVIYLFVLISFSF